MLDKKEVKMLKERTKRIILFSVFVGVFCFSNSVYAEEGGLGRATMRFLVDAAQEVGHRVDAMADRTVEYFEARQAARQKVEAKQAEEIKALEDHIRGREESGLCVSDTDRDKLNRAKDELERHKKQSEELAQKAVNFSAKAADAGIEVSKNLGMAAGDVIRAQGEKATKIGMAEAAAREQGMASIAKVKEWLRWVKDPQNIIPVAAVTVASIGATYVLYQGIKISSNYIESHLDQPTLVRVSSRLSMRERIKQLFGAQEITSRMSDIIIEPKTWEQLLDVAEETKKAKEFGDNLMNVMFYGPPGTGKTMFAKELALHSGLDFAMMSGADFSQFDEGKDIQELHKLFDWAEKSKKGLVIFVDEAEVFLADRGAASTDTRSKRLTDAFLSRVEKPTSKNLMFVFATNHPEVIDKAVLSRIGRQIKFDIPAITERTKILDLYFKKLFESSGVVVDDSVLEDIDRFGKQMDGFSPRQIETTVELIIKAARYKTDGVVTSGVAEKIINWKVDELKEQLQRNTVSAA
jgi:ATPase family AAA domain-containing protein 3A/B